MNLSQKVEKLDLGLNAKTSKTLYNLGVKDFTAIVILSQRLKFPYF